MSLNQPHIGYVLKVYPRFSETFIVTEILAREAHGEQLTIFALRPTNDARFHCELGRVQGAVNHIPKLYKLADSWDTYQETCLTIEDLPARLAKLCAQLPTIEAADLFQAIEVARQARAQGLTHLHAHFASLAGLVTAMAARLADLPYSVTTHAKDLFHETVDQAKLEFIISQARSVIAISEYNRRFLVNKFPQAAERIRLVRNGIELERFTYRNPQPLHEPLRVLAIGRLVEKKGFDLLIAAVSQLAAQNIKVEVRIAGDGELRNQLAQQISTLRLEQSVRLLGPMAQNEVKNLLAWADVMAAPCIVGKDGNADGLPTVILEALATGLPCIATDVTGISEVIQNGGPGHPATGILIPSNNQTALSEAISAFATGSFDRIGMAQAARNLVETEFDATVQAAKLAGVTA